MDIKQRLKRSFKLRFAILYPLGIFVAFFSNLDDNSMRTSIGFIISGLLIRLWANGYAIKMEKLTTCGPYALVRHPLYLGTLLLVVGFVAMLRIYIVGPVFIIIMSIIYYRTIKREEKMLHDKFKEEFINYKSKVPAMFPTIFPYKSGDKWPFSFKRIIENKEYKLTIWIIIMVIAFHIKEEFLVEREVMDAKIWSLIIIAFILGISDLIGEFIKWKKKKIREGLTVVSECVDKKNNFGKI